MQKREGMWDLLKLYSNESDSTECVSHPENLKFKMQIFNVQIGKSKVILLA